MQRDNFTCQLCKENDLTLHIHHLQYIKGKNPWEYINEDLTTLCEDCHALISLLNFKQMKIELSQFKIHKLTYNFQPENKTFFFLYMREEKINFYIFEKYGKEYNLTSNTCQINELKSFLNQI